MKKDVKISEVEMLEALHRSGYILESEITKLLSSAGFFVESNQIIADKLSGKSREIDLIAEKNDFAIENIGLKTVSSIKYIFEIKNNLFPIVLLTQFEFSPTIEDYLGLKEVVTVPEKVKYNNESKYYEQLIGYKNKSIFTQYCSFQKKNKNDELMALHPDIIHEGLLKITQYCEEAIVSFNEYLNNKDEKDEYFRHLLYLPILLINDELYELKNEKLKKVDSSILVFNYYFNHEPKMAYVFVVTRDGFSEFIEGMTSLNTEVENEMIKLKIENSK